MPTFIGLDLSLTSTGWARLRVTDDGALLEQTTGLIRSKATGPARLWEIRTAIDHLLGYPDLVAVEGYAYGRPNGMAALGELGGVIRLFLHQNVRRYVDVPPSTLKTYATGKGNAGKVDVLIAARDRLGYPGTSNDEADALWLAHLAAHHHGTPAVTLPKTHTRALDKLGAAA